jgi:hypothetical protein
MIKNMAGGEIISEVPGIIPIAKKSSNASCTLDELMITMTQRVIAMSRIRFFIDSK